MMSPALVRRATARQFQTVILCYVQIPSQLFDLPVRAVCRGNNELFLVPWNKALNVLIISAWLIFYSKV
jgi:hypothetical protein